MNRKLVAFILCLANFSFLFGHEAHEGISSASALKNWTQWIGNFHLIFLHFPIALIVMAGISECLYLKYKNFFFEHATRFMLIAAAIATIPTVLTGLAFSYGVPYEGEMADFFWWHRFLGFFIAALSFLTVILKELTVRKTIKSSVFYFVSLLILFISVNITGYLGGEMTFSSYRLLPPFL